MANGEAFAGKEDGLEQMGQQSIRDKIATLKQDSN